MGYDHEIALYLLAENQNVATSARRKIDAAINGNLTLRTTLLQAIAEVRDILDVCGFGEYVFEYLMKHVDTAAKAAPLTHVSAEAIGVSMQKLDETQKRINSSHKSYVASALEYAGALPLGTRMDLVVLLSTLNAPELLVEPFATSVFMNLNELPEDDRRELIGMKNDLYTLRTELARQITLARTEWAIRQASGEMWQPPPPDTSSAFSWPSVEPTFTLVAPAASAATNSNAK